MTQQRSPLITPTQLRLARVLLGLDQGQAGERWGLAARTISRHECGDQPLGVKTQQRILEQLRGDQVFFGPGVSVCYGENLFEVRSAEK